MTQIKISIVTPSFNQGRFIEMAIISVLNQHYENFEHIIVDNCSTDETLEIISRYPHIRLLSEPDEGQSDALNKGFKMASGDVIGWLNADDYYLPKAFSQVEQTFQSTEADAVYSNVKFVNAQGDFIRNLKSHRPIKWMSVLYTYIQSTSFFFKKQLVEDGHLLQKNLHYSMDMEFFARLLFRGYKFRYVNAYFACFRWHESNKTNNSSDVQKKHLRESFLIINSLTNLRLAQTKRNEALYLMAIKYVAKPIRGLLVMSPIK